MRLPRDVPGRDLAKRLSKLGCAITRQTGSHMRLTTEHPSRHEVTVPDHDPIRVGTLAATVRAVAAKRGVGVDELARLLFGKS